MIQHNKNLYRLLAAIFAVILVFIYTNHQNALPTDSSKWQAVFLSDGQVYFGKLRNYNNRFATLDQVYYLKFSEGLQQARANGEASPQLNLIKLGGEAHGPEGKMYIARDKIMFVENLRDNSKVAQAITAK